MILPNYSLLPFRSSLYLADTRAIVSPRHHRHRHGHRHCHRHCYRGAATAYDDVAYTAIAYNATAFDAASRALSVVKPGASKEKETYPL